MKPGVALDLNSLAVDFRLLPAVPAHSAVQAGRKRLAQLRADSRHYPEMRQDASAVLEFSESLLSSADTLAKGLILAGDAARFSTAGSWDVKLADGLRALSTTLSLADSSVTTAVAVKDLFDRTYPQFTSLDFGTRFSRDGVRVERVECADWKDQIWSTLQQLPPADSEPVKAAWSLWRDRMASYLSQSTASFTPAIDDVRTLAAQVPPGTVMKCRLQDMSVAAWSDILAEPVLRRGFPAWTAIAAFVALGFGHEANSAFHGANDRVKDEAERQHYAEFRRLARQRAHPRRVGAILIVLAESGSIVRDWKPATSVAAIALPSQVWPDFLTQAGSFADLNAVRLDGILAEVTGSEDLIERQLNRTRADVLTRWPDSFRSLPFAWLIPRATKRFEAKEPCVVGASDLVTAHSLFSTVQHHEPPATSSGAV